MITFIKKIFKLRSLFITNQIKGYIKFNRAKWFKKKIKPRGIVLVDLFEWHPFTYFFSYISNLLRERFNLELKFFYFPLYKSRLLNFKFSINKIIKIYKSFNVDEGLNSLSFKYDDLKKDKIKKIFRKNITSKYKLAKYKYKNLQIGDLIYDTYLRSNISPTVDLKNKYLLKLFIDAHFYLDEIEKYFKKNEVKAIIVSHHVYIQYGLIARYAVRRNIPAIQIHYLKFGQQNFNLVKLDRYCLKDYPYYDYNKVFTKFKKKSKEKFLKIGKKLIKNRVSGIKDYTSIYMSKSTFAKSKIKLEKIDKKKKKIIIFSHNFYDSPHRHRFMTFPDFYEYLMFFGKISEKFKEYQWLIKPHPNDTASSDHIFKNLSEKFPNIIILNKKVSNIDILRLKPNLIITNHSTAGHEFAYLKIPVLNTGDNIHIDYNFNLHARSKKEILDILKNLDFYINKISYNRDLIYEFMYMHFVYYYKRFDREGLIEQKYFYNESVLKNKKIVEHDDNLLDWYVKNDKKASVNIKKYINKFIEEEIQDNIN